MTDLFEAPDDLDRLARLRRRLAADAERDGLLDVAYRTVDTPVGVLLVAGTERGLLRVAYPQEDHDAVLHRIATVISPRVLAAPARLDPVTHELEDYFAGRLRSFTVPLDLRLAHGFRRSVLEHLATIGYGRTESYAEVAIAAGSPRAHRAVGSACATNPLPIVVPCHRVLLGDGRLGQYLAGTEVKQTLLALERGDVL